MLTLAHALLLPTIQANLAHAIRNRESVRIGGGEFKGEELVAVFQAIDAAMATLRPAPSLPQ